MKIPTKDHYVCRDCNRPCYGYVDPRWKRPNPGSSLVGICQACAAKALKRHPGADAHGQGYFTYDQESPSTTDQRTE